METTSYSQAAGAAHGNSGGNFPKFGFDLQFEARLAENKTIAVFEYWDKSANNGQGARQMVKAPVEGPLIGKAMMLQGFNKDTKVWYRSTPFFSNKDKVVVFESLNGVSKRFEQRDFSGNVKNEFTAEEAKNAMLVAAQSSIKKMALIYLAMLGKTTAQVIRVCTNLTLSIHDINIVKMDTFKSHQIKMTPVMFDKNMKLDKIAAQALEKTIKDNESQIGYAQITAGGLVDQHIEAEFGRRGKTLVTLLNDFTKWKDHVTGGGVSANEGGAVDNGNPVTNVNSNPQPVFNAAPAPNFEAPATNTPPPAANNNSLINDDLPF